MNEQDQMRQFAENLWNQFFANKVDKAMAQTVSYFRARVTDNPGSGKLEVQRPFDTAHIVSCTDALSNASAGDEVTVFVFGSENGNNAVAVSDGSMSTLGSGGGGGGGSVAWTDVTGKPTTISGYGITDAKIVSNTITLGGNSVTVPTVNDATLTIQKNGTTVETFTANASANATANITVPTTTSELTNNSGFITSPSVPYFTCSTGKDTVAKVGTLVSGTFAAAQLVTGAQIIVKFTEHNTSTNPTLNANGTGAIAIKRYGTTAAGTSAGASWNAGAMVMFIYDGTYWVMEDWLNTTYSSMTDAQVIAGTSTTAMLITPARLKLGVQTHAPVQSVNGATGAVTISPTTDVLTSVSASTWVADSTYTGFDYKCEIDVTGYDVDSTSFAEVTFDADEAVSGDYAPVCTTGTDTVTIYSKVNTSITIPSILIVRAS